MLAEQREQRRLSPKEVGQQLLMSGRQVRGIETADASAFHNATFFVMALEKYAAFLNVSLTVSREQLLREQDMPVERPIDPHLQS